jgi:apolipoprotein N-acyltransferase
MEKLSLKLKLALGLLSALLIFFSFPPYEIPFLSVLGLAIYFMIISDFKSFKRGLFLSLYTGFFIGVLLFYWFYYPISEVYGLPTWIGFLAPIPAGILYSLFHFGIMYPILHLTYSITDLKLYS